MKTKIIAVWGSGEKDTGISFTSHDEAFDFRCSYLWDTFERKYNANTKGVFGVKFCLRTVSPK